MGEHESVAVPLINFDNLVRQLKISSTILAEKDLLVQLFLSLSEKYDALVTTLQNLKEEKLTLNIVKERLILEDSKFHDNQGESPA